jgi:fusion and transport protein UGO1
MTSTVNNLLVAGFTQYASTAIAMPWEVGKTLLQVQWVPRDARDLELNAELEEEDGEVFSFSSASNFLTDNLLLQNDTFFLGDC